MDISPLLSSSIDWHGSDFWNWQQDKEDDKNVNLFSPIDFRLHWSQYFV